MNYPHNIKAKMVIALLGIMFCNHCLGAGRVDSQKHFDDIKTYVQNGQYNLAEDTAIKWAAIPDVDLELMSEACGLLSNEKLHEAAVVLLEKLDWIMPTQCHWPTDTLRYMEKQGLNKEIDRVLTYGTALTAKEDTRRISHDKDRHRYLATHRNALALE